ncbi:MAG: hypothetical protein K6U74_10500, partial [Firmicutes bacterium]|nr:hypothetical protein [Bacillota bacterium]
MCQVLGTEFSRSPGARYHLGKAGIFFINHWDTNISLLQLLILRTFFRIDNLLSTSNTVQILFTV